MSKLIIKVKRVLRDDDRERLEFQLKKDLENNGFAVIDDNFEVYEIEEKEEK